jgi:hypothetical protein
MSANALAVTAAINFIGDFSVQMLGAVFIATAALVPVVEYAQPLCQRDRMQDQ